MWANFQIAVFIQLPVEEALVVEADEERGRSELPRRRHHRTVSTPAAMDALQATAPKLQIDAPPKLPMRRYPWLQRELPKPTSRRCVCSTRQ